MDQVEEVKSKIDIVSVIGEHIQLKKAGRNFKALCPFHSEKTPSFMVSQELQIYKCFGCFPAGQFVKTPFGYHKIEDIVDGEYVVSGKGNLKKVITTHKRGYKGKLITVKTSQLTEPVSLTEDHLVYTIGGAPLYKNHYKYLSKRLNSYLKYSQEKKLEKISRFFPVQKIRAGDLAKGMTLLYPIDTTVSDVETLDLTEYITKKWPSHGIKPLIPQLQVEVGEDLLKIIGYYVAEGSNNRAYIRFSLGDHEREFAKEIVWLVKKIFGINAKIHFRKKGTKTGLEISACNSILANVFENLCGKGAENKHVPFILQQLPVEKQAILLDAVFKGDGFEQLQKEAKTIRRSITTISRVLSEQLTDILLRSGFFPSRGIVSGKYDKKRVHHRKAFVISWSADPKVSKFHHFYRTEKGETYWILPVLRIKRKRFSGKVYNLTVEDDHSYVANNFSVANCGESGDVFSFLQKYEGMEFREALKTLADRVGVKLRSYKPGEESEKERLIELHRQASRFYHWVLLNHPVGRRALDYLTKERGLSVETIKTFRLGYSPEAKGAISKFLVEKKKFNPKELERAGLGFFRGRDFIDKFAGRIIFPLFDHRGNTVGFAGRVLPSTKTEMGKYINSPETPIYHKSKVLFGLNLTKEAIKNEGGAILVEGEMDAIPLWQEGFKNVVAIKGTSLTEDQVRLVGRFTKNLTISFDTDFAGNTAARRGVIIAQEEGLDVRVADLVAFKDPGEAVLKDKESYAKTLEGAVSVWDFIINSTFKKFDAESGEGKAKISRELIPVLAGIPDKIVQAHYINLVSQKLGVAEDAVKEEVEKVEIKKEDQKIKVSVPQKPEIKTRRQLLEERLLTLVFQSDPKTLLDENVSSLVTTPLAKRIISEYKKYSESHLSFSPSDFASYLPSELVDGFAQMALTDTAGVTENPDSLSKELGLVLHELTIIDIRYRLQELGVKIRQFEEERKEDKLKSTQEKFGELTQRLAKLEGQSKSGIIFH